MLPLTISKMEIRAVMNFLKPQKAIFTADSPVTGGQLYESSDCTLLTHQHWEGWLRSIANRGHEMFTYQ